jgi:hypothetical protein
MTLFLSAKGLASLVGGQIIAHTSWQTQEIFQMTFGLTSGLALISLIIYHTVGKGLEKKHLAKKSALLERVKAEKKQGEVGGIDNEGVEGEKHGELEKDDKVEQVKDVEDPTRKRSIFSREDSYGDILESSHPVGHDAYVGKI